MFKKHNPAIPFGLKAALLLLAISVFGWGLQAKLSLYRTDLGKSSSIAHIAKLLTEKRSAQSAVSIERHNKPQFTAESLHLAAYAFSFHHFPQAGLGRVEPGPSIPGRYNLHGPDPMRRPPPALS